MEKHGAIAEAEDLVSNLGPPLTLSVYGCSYPISALPSLHQAEPVSRASCVISCHSGDTGLERMSPGPAARASLRAGVVPERGDVAVAGRRQQQRAFPVCFIPRGYFWAGGRPHCDVSV